LGRDSEYEYPEIARHFVTLAKTNFLHDKRKVK
jgi:hypothetical protein